jgi:hypothetical protein
VLLRHDPLNRRPVTAVTSRYGMAPIIQSLIDLLLLEEAQMAKVKKNRRAATPLVHRIRQK